MKKILRLCAVFLIIPVFIYSMSLDRATFQVGRKFFTQRLFTEAEQRFLDIVRKYPDSPYFRQSLFYLGQTYAYQGKYKSALQYYRFLLNKSRTVKERQTAILGIAKSWLQLGEHDKAIQFYSFFATEYPESEHAPSALYFAGISGERANNIPGAVEKYRAVIENYPESDVYAKAIEKIAVLETDTPESLWTDPPENISDPSVIANVEMFADDKFDLSGAPGMDVAFKAQSLSVPQAVVTQMISPSVVTQVIIQQPAEPTIITQQVEPVMLTQTIFVTQQVEVPTPVEDNLDPATVRKSALENFESAQVVHLSNNQYVPIETQEQKTKREEIEAYRKIWEEEFYARLKNENLDKAKQSVRELLQLTENKAQVLAVKEELLGEEQNRLRSTLYNELQELQGSEEIERFETTPIFTRQVTNTVTVTNNVNLAAEQIAQPIVSPEEQEPSIDQINQDDALNDALAEYEYNSEVVEEYAAETDEEYVDYDDEYYEYTE